MDSNLAKIVEALPYSHPFLFVDELTKINDVSAEGSYTFPVDSFFYQGHFIGNPVTPGVILTECMAQIGVVCLGINLLADEENLQEVTIAFSSSTNDYYLPVYPGEKVVVKSEKQFFRFNKLKCLCKMYNAENKLVCKAEISGMLIEKEG